MAAACCARHPLRSEQREDAFGQRNPFLDQTVTRNVSVCMTTHFQAADPCGSTVPVRSAVWPCGVDASTPPAFPTGSVGRVFRLALRPFPTRWLVAGPLPVPVPVSTPDRVGSPRRGRLIAAVKSLSKSGQPARHRYTRSRSGSLVFVPHREHNWVEGNHCPARTRVPPFQPVL